MSKKIGISKKKMEFNSIGTVIDLLFMVLKYDQLMAKPIQGNGPEPEVWYSPPKWWREVQSIEKGKEEGMEGASHQDFPDAKYFDPVKKRKKLQKVK